MFPIRSGIGNANSPDQDKVFFQGLAASAMHEIGKYAVRDTSLLMFHQYAAETYYREDELAKGTPGAQPIPENPDGTFNLYTPEQELQLRKRFIDTVMKYHILHPSGLGSQLGPLVDYMSSSVALDAAAASNPFIQAVIAGESRYRASLSNGSLQQTMNEILDFSEVENRSEEENTAQILASYGDPNEEVSVAVCEDGTVQCACPFCETYFAVWEEEFEYDPEDLNPIQAMMLENYHHFEGN